MLGPFPFLTAENTRILQSTEAAPRKSDNSNYGVEFNDVEKWYELGLKGLEYIKTVLGVQHVTYMVVGLGQAVKKEIEMVALAPDKYPTGINELTVITVMRDT